MSRKANGLAIASIRRALGMPQNVLAGRAGITAPFLSQIEHGDRQPSVDVLRRIAAELGVAVAAITYPVPEPDQPEAAAS